MKDGKKEGVSDGRKWEGHFPEHLKLMPPIRNLSNHIQL